MHEVTVDDVAAARAPLRGEVIPLASGHMISSELIGVAHAMDKEE